jgi:hypothetical protein
MGSRWQEQTGTITIRYDDDGAVFEPQENSTFREVRDQFGISVVEDKLKDARILELDGQIGNA